MKIKRLCSVALVVTLLFSLSAGALATSSEFTDVAGHWSETTIRSLAESGTIDGYPDGSIRPDNTITRGEFAALTARAFGYRHTGEDGSTWAQGYIRALAEAEIITSDEVNGFAPNGAITRIEMLRMLVRAMGLSDELSKYSDKTNYADDELLSDSDRSFINLAKGYGFLNGYPNGEVRAYTTATRAEAFVLLSRFLALREQGNPDNKDKENPGSGSGYVPVYHAEISFELPAYAYTNTDLTVVASTKHVRTVKWTLCQDGEEMDAASALEGTLGADGGSIRFLKAGNYTLQAAAIGISGKEAVCERPIRVYDAADMVFMLPATAHTDTAIPIEVHAENLGERDILWTVQCNGEDAAYDGTLTNRGGVVRFVQAGSYTVTAAAADDAGNPISYMQSVEVFPAAVLSLNLPKTAHTDETVAVRLDAGELNALDVVWTHTRNGEAVEYADWIDGSLAGGSVRFIDRGVYTLTASVTDATGRVYSDTGSITVYPVGSAGFYLPEICHTDDFIAVEAVFDGIGSRTAEWSLVCDGKALSLSDAAEGTLTNGGGVLRFYKKGSYILRAEFTDDGGRTYCCEQSFVVYPIPVVSYSLPSAAHTDTKIPITVTTENTEDLRIEWLVDNTYGFQHWDTYIDGTLTNSGGSIRFKHAGTYQLTARVTDATGRVFLYELGDRCEVQPVLHLSFSLPTMAHIGNVLSIRSSGNNNVLPVDWTLTRNGTAVPLESNVSGTLNAYGGNISFTQKGSYQLTASIMDVLGRVFSATESIEVIPVAELSISAPGAVHYGTPFDVSVVSANLEGRSLVWTLTQNGAVVLYSGTLDDSGGRISISTLGSFTLTATVTDVMGSSYSHAAVFEITNTAPNTPLITAEPTRTVKNGAFLVNVSAVASDGDGDTTELEWDGTTADSYYPVGSHTIRVRARDSIGAYSDWAETVITIANSAPTTPVITRSPSGNSVAPGTPVTITAVSTDPDGDPITLVWEGRNAERQTYPLGKNIVRVKAVDATGAESPWAAIMFFVADASSGGGMTLTGPESVILENGLEGATIANYTFTVPPVDGHSGEDYGRVRGYNVLTGQWDQLDYGTTSNGITFVRTLQVGVYSKLEFYYYTNHSCMYNKSNITYSVEYHFE